MPTDRVDKVEAPLPRLKELQRLEALVAELKAQQALKAPIRPRRWHKQECSAPPSCPGCSVPRENQVPPAGDGWNIWLILSGRGWGKTAVGAQWLASQAARNPGTEWAIIAPTWRDARKVCIEGRSGLLKALLPAGDGYPAEVESINLSDLTIRLTNGSKIYGYSADGYERLRGSNLAGAWCVAKGSLVRTARGDVPVEHVRVGDLVATRQGWCRVSVSRRTGVNRATVAITTTAGILRCTPDHRIAVSEHGWREARFVNVGDTLIGCTSTPPLAHPHGTNTTGTATIETPASATTTTPPATCSTMPSGSTQTGPSRRIITFITEIMIAVTTDWSTFNSSPPQSTGNITSACNGCQLCRSAPAQCAESSSSLPLRLRTFCAAQVRAALRRPRKPAKSEAPISASPVRLSASSAGQRSPRKLSTRHAAPMSAARTVLGPAPAMIPVTTLAGTGSRSSSAAPLVMASSKPPQTTPSPAVWLAVGGSTLNKQVTVGATGSQPSGPASTAATSSFPGQPQRCTAPSSAVPEPVVLSIAPSLDCDVYDLTVEGAHEFFASGILVHNCDEAAVMANVSDMFSDALMPALRIGEAPKCLITTTPRPIRFLRELIEREDGSVAVTRGSTWDNAANLSRTALAELRTRYEGTRAGRQELDGELLVDIEGALWSRDWVDDSRVMKHPTLTRVIVGVDPAVTSGEKSDSTGIVVVGKSHDGHVYVLEDLTMKGSPHACMTKAVSAYHRWRADKIVAERNNGGDYLEGVLRTVDANVSYGTVYATRGKVVRAEPISALWEQQRGHIVGSLPELEDQMCSYTSDTDDSPDNFDAFIWAASELNVGGSAMGFLASISEMCHKCTLPSPKGSPRCKHCGVSLNDAA